MTDTFDLQAMRVMVSDHRAIHGTSPVLDALAAACDEIEGWRNYRQWCLDPAPDEQHCACVPGLWREIDKLTAERDALRALLARHEWGDYGDRCPECMAWNPTVYPGDPGHTSACDMAAALRQAREEERGE